MAPDAIISLIVCFAMSGTDYLYNSASENNKRKIARFLMCLYYSISVLLIILYVFSNLKNSSFIIHEQFTSSIKLTFSTGKFDTHMLTIYLSISFPISCLLYKIKNKTSLFELVIFTLGILYICWQIPTFPSHIAKMIIYIVLGIVLEFIIAMIIMDFKVSGTIYGILFASVIGIVMFVLNCIPATRISLLDGNVKLFIFATIIIIEEGFIQIPKASQMAKNIFFLSNALVLIMYIESQWGFLNTLKWVYSFMQ